MQRNFEHFAVSAIMTLSVLLVAVFLSATALTATAVVYSLTTENFMDVIDGPHHKIIKFYGDTACAWSGCIMCLSYVCSVCLVYICEDD